MAETAAPYDFLGPPTKAGDLGSLAHYRVIDELGKGGMGYVFRAEDSKLQRSVALKVMNQKIAATSNSRRRFLHEARAMAAVHHDNVATIFEVGESNGTPFMAMEMLKGSTLETFNKDQHRLGYEQIIQYARQIATGLAAAHAKGIVHRDIKPANIWIEEGNDRIKILDFGLALASTPVDHLSGRGAVIGTPGYLSPEQARSEPLDDRSDLYSLGVVLYELATGQLPLQSGSVSGQLIAILAHRPIPIHELNPDIPRPLCDLIHRLLRKEPRMRPQSAIDLVAELDRVRIDCEASSEVAQAINKLQVGLSQVVSKSDAGSIMNEIDEFPATISDPLAGIPMPSAPASSLANSGRFVVPKQIPTKVSSGPNWQAYGPLLAIVALIVTILPATIFFFNRAGRSTKPYVVSLAPEDQPAVDSGNADQLIGAEKAEERKRRAREALKKYQEKAALEANANTTPADPAAASTVPEAAEPERADPDIVMRGVEADSSPAKTPAEPTAPAEPATSTSATPVDRNPAAVSAPTPGAEKASAPQLVWKEITTADGRGADVTIQKGLGKNLDDRQTLSVFVRGGVDIDHSYLRFDLASVQSDKQNIESVELVLTVANKRPVGSNLQLHGVPQAPLEWPERELVWDINAPSFDGLNDEPLLATHTIGPATGENIVRFSSDSLTKFIVDSPLETVTLILAGSNPNNKKERVEFYSKEKLKAAPMLRLQIPQRPPPPVDVHAELAAETLVEVRRVIADLKRVDTERADTIIQLVEEGKFESALNQVKDLIGEIQRSGKAKRSIDLMVGRFDKLIESIQQASQPQSSGDDSPPDL